MALNDDELEREFLRQIHLCRRLGYFRMKELLYNAWDDTGPSTYTCRTCGRTASFLTGHACPVAEPPVQAEFGR